MRERLTLPPSGRRPRSWNGWGRESREVSAVTCRVRVQCRATAVRTHEAHLHTRAHVLRAPHDLFARSIR